MGGTIMIRKWQRLAILGIELFQSCLWPSFSSLEFPVGGMAGFESAGMSPA